MYDHGKQKIHNSKHQDRYYSKGFYKKDQILKLRCRESESKSSNCPTLRNYEKNGCLGALGVGDLSKRLVSLTWVKVNCFFMSTLSEALLLDLALCICMRIRPILFR